MRALKSRDHLIVYYMRRYIKRDGRDATWNFVCGKLGKKAFNPDNPGFLFGELVCRAHIATFSTQRGFFGGGKKK